VGTVRSTAAGDGSLHDGVVDEAVISVQLLSLSVGLEVDEELSDALDRFLGPATLGCLESLGLGSASNSTVVASEGNNLLVFQNVVHVGDGLVEVHTFNGASYVISVLVVGTQVTNSALCRYQKEEERCEKTDWKLEREDWNSTYIWQARRAV